MLPTCGCDLGEKIRGMSFSNFLINFILSQLPERDLVQGVKSTFV